MALPPLNAPGGGAFAAYNAINQASLDARKKELENMFYAPAQQAEINYKTGLTSKIPGEIAYQNLVNKYYGPNISSEIGSRDASAAMNRQQTNELAFLNAHRDLQLALKAGGPTAQAALIPYLSSNALVQGQPGQAAMPAQAAQVQMGLPQQGSNPFAAQQGNPGQMNALNMPNLGSQMPQGGIANVQNALGNLRMINQQPAMPAMAARPALPAVSPQSLALAAFNADVDKKKFYASGQGRPGQMTAGQKEENAFISLVAKDNPELNNDPNLVREAANNIRQGKMTLDDGTPLNQPAPDTLQALSRSNMKGTTAMQTNQLLNARQAEAELDVFSNAASNALAPYGDTFAGFSTKQIADTFKSDEASQKRLGEYIGSETIQNEIAQLRTKLSGASPSVTQTQEIEKLSMQKIKTEFPFLSAKARKYANDFVNDTIKQGFDARQQVGIQLTNVGGPGSNATPGTTVMHKDGKVFHIPNDKVAAAQKAGYING